MTSRTSTGLILAVSFALVAGAPDPAAAQLDLSGTWTARYQEDYPERLPGPELGDYLGLPISDAARLFAESWDPSRLTLLEHQCRVHVAPYIYRGPMQFRSWEERDPKSHDLVAIRQYISTYEQSRTIYMDGRPHPSEHAAHTWMGFSTGRWLGDILQVRTTHLKQGWLRRNGLPMSDRAEMTEYFIRHGTYLTHVEIVEDPIYLTEPLIKSEDFVLAPRSPDPSAWLWHCEAVEEVVDRPRGEVPNYLPGQNPFLEEFRNTHKLPEEATRGGAETMYPEFVEKLKALLAARRAAPAAAPAAPPRTGGAR